MNWVIMKDGRNQSLKSNKFFKKEGTMKSRNNKTSLQWIILFEVFFFFNLKQSNQTKDRYVRLQTKSKIHSNTNEIGLCLYHCKIFIFIL